MTESTENLPAAAGHEVARIAVFTHDTFGLGHVRRCLHVIRSLSAAAPRAAVLLITGSPALQALEGLPASADYVKIPTIAKTGAKGHQPPHLSLPVAEVSLIREAMIREAVASFAPDVLLVDNFPLGSQGELLPALQEARRLGAHAVLGLRDILDSPEKVRAEWTRQGIYGVLDRYYDRVLVYGMREVFDVEESYALPPHLAAKVRYCGYVTATAGPLRPAGEVRAELGFSGPFLAATTGGGGDGYPLLSALFKALPHVPELPVVVFTGPLMSDADRESLHEQADGRAGLLIREYVEDLPSYLAAADLVVSMCGYNVAAEIVATRARALVVPRTWRYGEHRKRESAGLEWEQLLRAQALARLGLVEVLEPDDLSPKRLAQRIETTLARPREAPRCAVDLKGLERVTQELLTLARTRGGTRDAGG